MHALGLTESVGVIVVAVIGNAAEHSTAVLMAMKNKMDLAINIAVGSSDSGSALRRSRPGVPELCVWKSNGFAVYAAWCSAVAMAVGVVTLGGPGW